LRSRNSSLPILIMSDTRSKLQLEEEIKNAIYALYELDRGIADGKVHPDLLTDYGEQRFIFEDPDVQEFLETLVEEHCKDELDDPRKEKKFKRLMWREFKRIIRELDAESAGIPVEKEKVFSV